MTPGGAASGQKGSRYERELVNAFRDDGWGALRLPSSGSATERDLPDVLAGQPEALPIVGEKRRIEYPDAAPNDFIAEMFTDLYAIEAKAGKASTLYVDADEVEALEAFARTWGATPLLAARSTRQATPTDHYLVRPADARMTDAGRYGLPVADVAERAFAVVGGDRVQFTKDAEVRGGGD